MGRSGVGRVEDGRKTTKGTGRKAAVHLKEFIPPDGGYGWVIVFAVGLINFCLIPIIQNFGLVYKDSLIRWNITTTEYSTILNLQFSVSNCVGLIMGPLLKTYGYRRITFCGTVMVSLSAVLTSQVNTFTLFLLTYSLLGGLGVGFTWISTSLAINTYFKARRGVATGIAWGATGLSPVVFPHLLTWLRKHYDVHGTVLITSGIMMHSIPAAMLLHPIERHAEFRTIEEGEAEATTPAEKEGDEDVGRSNVDESKKLVVESQVVRWVDEESDEGPEVPRGSVRRKRHSLPQHAARGDRDFFADTQETLGLDIATPMSLHASRVSLESTGVTNLRRTAGHSDFAEALAKAKGEGPLEGERPGEEVSPRERKSRRRRGLASRFVRFLKRVADYLDLYLLCDMRFLLIFIGLTLAYGGEINFSLLAPFVFLDRFSMEKVAVLMSTLASVDLVTRFTVPIFSDRYKLNSIAMFSFGLIILAIGRIMLAHLSGYSTILWVSAWLGLGKGFRTIYMALVMPSIVPLEKLASASGLQTLVCGIFFFIIGPIFGYIRDKSDSYVPALYAINIFTFGALLSWLLAALYSRRRKRREVENNNKKENKTKCANSLIVK